LLTPRSGGGRAESEAPPLFPDGRIAVTGSYDRTVKLWNMPAVIADLRDPVAVACALAGPAISHDDWQRYLTDLPAREIC